LTSTPNVPLRWRETGASAYPSLDEALAGDAFDAALVMLPHHVHEETALALLDAGKHVLLEKPIAPTVAAAERVLARAAATEVHFQVGENAQYWPEITAVADALADHAIGDVITARAWHCHPPMTEFYGGPDPWRCSTAAAGGGVAIDTGSHWLRPLRRWLGELVEVLAVTGRPYPGMEGESMCRALCRFDNGVVASFDVLLVPWAAAPLPPFQVTGTGGELVVEAAGRVLLYDGSDPAGRVVGEGNYFQSYEAQIADFEAAVLDGRPAAATAEYALGELRGALAMYRSAESGRWEAVW
jgi:UDP-N-acetyl-2-amino-2-deoxyglucuronate dehydrogenase